ncbi:hypothetical protein ACFL17_10380 [Pseudomonadota bacterium]
MIAFDPYKSTPPELVKSFVCYVDILGFSQLSKEAITSSNGDVFLRKIHLALTRAYDRVRKNSNEWSNKQRFSIKIFTDNIVVGYPIKHFTSNLGESELGHIFSVFSDFQVGLALEGFLVRGGIAFGDHYMDDEIVFGDALLGAVNQDSAGGAPKISLAPSAVKILQHHLGFYSDPQNSPQSQYLLEDSDNSIFVNYLERAFIAFPDAGIFFEVFEKHKKTLIEGLKKYSGNPDVRAKYEWAARYHNFVCDDFLEKNSIPTSLDVDEFYAAAVDEAQTLLEYKIDIESLAGTPSRLLLKPILPKGSQNA